MLISISFIVVENKYNVEKMYGTSKYLTVYNEIHKIYYLYLVFPIFKVYDCNINISTDYRK